ncbi:MAG: hypothetical protein PHQ19_03495 [Candidatus Krumholzibacteria bacterium]|nr:hypothetical protein [Candidatus Krumholzibacteria bacterium]
MPRSLRRCIRCCTIVLLASSPLSAQIEDHLAAYTGANAKGYLEPLADAAGISLSGGLYRGARIPKAGLTISLEFPVTGLFFTGDDETFMAATEGGFAPQRTVEAPTVVGPTQAVIVDGDGGTHFAFPGGFDVGSFAIVAPQLRVGSVFGTEAMVRFFVARIGGSELGRIMLAGFGARHSVSQYFPAEPPFDLAAGFFWQRLTLGENGSGADLLEAGAWSFGAQASRCFSMLKPYTGLWYNSYTLDVSYESDAGGEPETIEIDFEKDYVQWTIGLELDIALFDLFAEYNVAGRGSFAFGLALGF